MLNNLHQTTFALYLLATLFYLLRFIFDKQRFSQVAFQLTVLAGIFQFCIFFYSLYTTPSLLTPSYYLYFQLTSLGIAAVFLFLCFFKNLYSGGLFFVVAIDLFYILSFTNNSPDPKGLKPLAVFFQTLHLSAIFLCLVFFSIALIMAILFLISERQIKIKHFGGAASRLPSLGSLEKIHDKALFISFVLLTLAILLGAGFLKSKTGHYLALEKPKQSFGLVCWFFFAVFLNFKAKHGWRGHKGIALSLVGLLCLTLLFLIGLS
ncbi:cytochrome c biogenesis protein CcsA [bacterium]|nr:cytochrome c biogenesis protein CcsA [bacterium]MBU1918549.1 cytochrome c biogenesis protein CcsA [bacterium]